MVRANVRIRAAEPADIGAMVELLESVELHTPAFGARHLPGARAGLLEARLCEIVGCGDGGVLVAVEPGTGSVVGLAVVKRDEIGAIDPTPALHVCNMVVLPRMRRRGVGRALLAAVVQRADDDGIERVIASVGAGSREGNRYLARLGFAPLVTHRVASTGVLRRAVGVADTSGRVAVLRRARPLRSRRALGARVAGRSG